MFATLLATIFAICGQGTILKKGDIDRSGESDLRVLLEDIASRKRYSGVIIKSYREAHRLDFYSDGVVEFWKDGDSFRVEFSDMWGGSAIVVSNGKTVLDDQGNDPITLRQPGKTMSDNSPALQSQGVSSSPWFYFMEGPALLDRLDKDRVIKRGDTANTIVWDSTLFGRMSISRVKAGREGEVWEIEFDNIAWQKDMHKQFPEWYDLPDDDARWRQRVVLWPLGRLPRSHFNVKPGKGRQINDLTKAAKKPPMGP